MTDTQFALELFESREALMEFVLQENDDEVMDEISCDRRLREEQAKEKMIQITGCASASAFQQLEMSRRKELVAGMYQEGLSLGQISRMTGMPKTSVFKAVQNRQASASEEREPVFREPAEINYWMDPDVIW